MPALYGVSGGANRKFKELHGLAGGANRKLKALYGVSGGANRKIFQLGLLVDMSSLTYDNLAAENSWSKTLTVSADSNGLSVSGDLQHAGHGSSGLDDAADMGFTIQFPLDATKTMEPRTTVGNLSSDIAATFSAGGGSSVTSMYVLFSLQPMVSNACAAEKDFGSLSGNQRKITAGDITSNTSGTGQASGTALQLAFDITVTAVSNVGGRHTFSFTIPNEAFSFILSGESFPLLFS